MQINNYKKWMIYNLINHRKVSETILIYITLYYKRYYWKKIYVYIKHVYVYICI